MLGEEKWSYQLVTANYAKNLIQVDWFKFTYLEGAISRSPML